MKKIILGLVTISAMFAFSGCGGSVGPKITTASGDEYYIKNKGNGEYLFYSIYTKSNVRNKGESVHNASVKKNNLKFQLTAASKYTKKLGYKYFAVTNINISNLNGFPISNYNDLSRYITLAERKSNFATNGTARDSETLISNGSLPTMSLRFAPISDSVANSGAISVWKVSDFVR